MNMKRLLWRLIPSFIDEKIRNHYKREWPTYELCYSKKNNLSGRCILVTGGSGGLGSAISIRLASEGGIIGVCGRNKNKIEKVVTAIKENGGNAYPVIFDITQEDEIKNAIRQFVQEHGQLYAIINNAGGSAREKADLYKHEDLDVIKSVVQTNLLGTMILTHYAIPYMVPQNGRIINMSSVVGICGKSGMTDYAAAKAGIQGFTRSLAIELGPIETTVNSISPGYVSRELFNDKEEKNNVNCMNRIGKPEDIAGLVAYLLSDEANYITGQNIVIDGGRVLGLWGDN